MECPVLVYAVDEGQGVDSGGILSDEEGEHPQPQNWLQHVPEEIPLAIHQTHRTLRELNKKNEGKYPVYLLDNDCIRGFDFKRPLPNSGLGSSKICLLQLSPFPSWRDRIQGEGRVGRYGDESEVVIRQGCARYDKRTETRINTELFTLLLDLEAEESKASSQET